MSWEETAANTPESGREPELSEADRAAYQEFSNYVRQELDTHLPEGLLEWSADAYSVAETLMAAAPEDFANPNHVGAVIERANLTDEEQQIVLEVAAVYHKAIYDGDEAGVGELLTGTTDATEDPAGELPEGFDETETVALDMAYEAFIAEGRMERLSVALEDILDRDFASSGEAAEAIMMALGEVAFEVERDGRGLQYGIPVVSSSGKIGFVPLTAYDEAFTAIIASESEYGKDSPDLWFRPTPNDELMTEVLQKHFKRVG